ncbi:hypothetical protein GCM10010389_38600 [Streptomyces echinoruber]|uniref:Uncharacterized protein n=1 Tax=Streptomyces echinoruber TaxID=68898 RepID=A0A918RHY1_9ACTN|nr:hypothetical protein GCM10010389_38600 [Streptomyces echinoruber]
MTAVTVEAAAELAVVCTAMSGEALSPHLPHGVPRRETELAPSLAGSLAVDHDENRRRGVAGASSGRVPLPLWMSGMRLWTPVTPDMRWSPALFKTVTEGQDS